MGPHTFVVPAFGEPEWLERCLESLLVQTVRSSVLVTTSTPNRRIEEPCARLGIPVVVNPISSGIASDWNFAYGQASTAWVTLAHQDDTYGPFYTERCLAMAGRQRDPVLVFTAAHESFTPGGRLAINARFKRVLAATVFLGRPAIASRVAKRLLLSLGNPVPCSSVMLHKARLPGFRFPEGWKSNLDWRAWLDLAELPGAFVYIREPLVERALHADAATTRHLAARAAEDSRMFRDILPFPLAGIMATLYAGSRRPYRSLHTRGARRENGPLR